MCIRDRYGGAVIAIANVLTYVSYGLLYMEFVRKISATWFAPMLQPVSYTHQDVYKRQAFKVGQRIMEHMTDKYVMEVFELSRKVNKEADKIRGFIYLS